MNLTEAVVRLRLKINDNDVTKIFSDDVLQKELVDAMHKHNSDYTAETVPESEEYLVIKLAQISCFYTRAGQEAKNYRISVDGISIAKSERVKNYLDIANGLLKEYDAIINSPDYASIEVVNVKRYSALVNTLVGGDDPVVVVEEVIT